MRTKQLFQILVALTAIVSLGCPNPATPATDAAINLATIPGVTVPAFGRTPVTAITETPQYTGTVAWNGSPVTFAASTTYTATITLTAKAGYTLTGVAANFFIVTGATSDSNPENSGVVTAVFPVTGTTQNSVIDIAAIPGVTVPVSGATPVAAITDTAQYSGTVSWSDSPATFAASTTYTATITLTAKAGYTLTGVTSDFFTVAGATSDSNPVNSGVVTAIFPATIAEANLAPVTDYTGTGAGTLKAVQGGTFNNGTANMTVSSFRMSQHEITGEQYAEVMGIVDPSYFSSITNNPVEQVNWYATLVFCNKLSILEGLTPVYMISGNTDPTTWGAIPTTNNSTWNAVVANWSANGYRLPTEAEWQFAAAGGNSSDDYTYAGSNTIGDVAWHATNSSSTTHTVGAKTANELGLFDLSGNVREWCWDLYDAYPGTAQTDYRGADSGQHRVWRGGSWGHTEVYCTVAYRLSNAYPTGWTYTVGFRVVRH